MYILFWLHLESIILFLLYIKLSKVAVHLLLLSPLLLPIEKRPSSLGLFLLGGDPNKLPCGFRIGLLSEGCCMNGFAALPNTGCCCDIYGAP